MGKHHRVLMRYECRDCGHWFTQIKLVKPDGEEMKEVHG